MGIEMRQVHLVIFTHYWSNRSSEGQQSGGFSVLGLSDRTWNDFKIEITTLY